MVTVVVVNWNTKAILEVTLEAIRRHSPVHTDIVVIDNHSTDGSREWLRGRPHGVRPVLLPFNIHHGRGLDLGFVLARSKIVVTLDSDAFPYSDRWLDVLVESIESGDAVAAGLWGRRHRVHPACAAFRRDAYFRTNLSFSPFFSAAFAAGEEERFGENVWDTGELISIALQNQGTTLLPTDDLEYGGCTMAGVVYHHGALSRLPELDDQEVELRHQQAWDRAVRDLLARNV